MVQFVGFRLLIIVFSVTTTTQLSEWQCTRGTYKDVKSGNCTKCPENTFMGADNHTRTECERCRTTKKYQESHIEVRQECNATHDLYLNCSQNYFVQVGDEAPNRVECIECKVCSNGNKYKILPCNGTNDTFCCERDDMVAEPNKDGIYACASRPDTISSTTTTPTSAASNTSTKDASTSDVSSQTADVVTSPNSSGQTDPPDSSLLKAKLIGIPIGVIGALFIICLLIYCHKNKWCCFRDVGSHPYAPARTNDGNAAAGDVELQT